ncbi:MAG TPA: helix-turn-helix domain-containing protein [Caldimonas sp.]|jgi:AcrR family transcriptional regulator
MKTASAAKATPAPERVSARDRLLAAADELFYEGGIHTVGIDRVIERAGVAKASLYDSFGSKDALIRAYLEARHDARKARLTAWLERYGSPRERLLGVFDAMADLMKAKNFRGCAFTRASSESEPTSGVRSACDVARQWMRELFSELARDAGAADAEALATQLSMLYDGASVMGQIERSPRAALAARDAAAVLLDQATASAKAVRRRAGGQRR